MCWSKNGHTKFYMQNCEGNIGEPMDLEEKSCDGVETVREFTYSGDRMSVDG